MLCTILSQPLAAQETVVPSVSPTGAMTVTLLGTGVPAPNIDRFGPSTLVTVAGQVLLFDVGRGAILRMRQVGISASQLDQVFLTHYHSDHINGLPDLWLSGRLPDSGRTGPMQITGPTGLQGLTDGLRAAFAADIAIREADEMLAPESTLFENNEFTGEGVVYEKDGVRVTAFTVSHGALIKPAVGYRIESGDSVVILSGDTRYDPNLIVHSDGADLLVHEVATARPELLGIPVIQRILGHHTTPPEAGRVFSAVKPGLAVYNHLVLIRPPGTPEQSPEELIAATRETYDGPLLVGEDLMSFSIDGDTVTAGRAIAD